MNSEEHLRKLITAMLDESISEEQMKELDNILLESSEAREIYRRIVDMHFTLQENEADEVMIFPGLPEPEKLPAAFSSLKRKLIIFQTIAALLAVAFLVSLFLEEDAKTITVTKEVHVETAPKVLLAKVTETSDDIKWKSAAKVNGDAVYNEVLEVEAGELTLTYEHGAVIKIKGPAYYELHSLDKAGMKFGQLAASIPEAAQGFTVDAPKAAIVDLGTEFALNVTHTGKSQVYVYKGEVESSLLGSDGNTLVNASLFEDDSIEIDSQNDTIDDLPGNIEFIRVNKKSEAGLNITDKYVKMIKKADPLGYWRFEKEKDRIVKNEMSSSFPGRLTYNAQVRNNVFFVGKGSNGAMIIDEALKGINQNGYTIEMWVNAAERGSEMALASLVEPEPVKDKKVYQHITHIQLMSRRPRLRHKPFDFRFSHRFPATQNTGKNAFAGQAYEPGAWYHLVCVKNTDSFSLYLNGQLKQTVKDSPNNDPLPYLLYIGLIDPIRIERQFIGQIDELAIYKRPLSSGEIVEHYQAVSFD